MHTVTGRFTDDAGTAYGQPFQRNHEECSSSLNEGRKQALDRLLEIYGGPIEALTRDAAMELLNAINTGMASSPHCPVDVDGYPGGVVDIPSHLTPVLIGDLHARVDNLLTILSENALMENLDRGDAALVFLGDAIHSDEPDLLTSMDASVVMMDLIFKLKLQYPNQVFFLLGNHDCFSEHLVKCGVPQAVLWEKHLLAIRGEEYRCALQRFYRYSPIVAMSSDFVACHAGPPRAKVSREILINVRNSPQIADDLIWKRLNSPACPVGYTKSDVRRFRKSLGLSGDIPFIVAHSPFAGFDTVWRNIGRIHQHHLVYSAKPNRVGLFVRVNGEMVPQVYPAQSLLPWVNRRASRNLSNSILPVSPFGWADELSRRTLELVSNINPHSVAVKM